MLVRGRAMATILVIDDDATVRRDIKRALSRDGHSLIEATGPEDGLRCARQHRPDMILLDVVMPGTDGIGVLRLLSEDPSTARIPVIIVSALGEATQVAACLDEGAADHVAKPFSHQDLRTRVEACLQSSQAPVRVDTKTAGKIVSFVGAKGGVGTTTLALNVATSWALEQQSVILAELRPRFGGVSILLNASPEDDLGLLLGNSSALTDFYVEQVLAQHSSGLRLLFSPQTAQASTELDEQRMVSILSAVSRTADITVLDVPTELTDANIAALRHSDVIALVLERDMTSLRAAAWLREQLNAWPVQRPIVGVVVNRSGLSAPPQLDEIRRVLRCELLSVIPLAGDALQSAAKAGQTLVEMLPQDAVAAAYRETSQRLSHEIQAASSLDGLSSGQLVERRATVAST